MLLYGREQKFTMIKRTLDAMTRTLLPAWPSLAPTERQRVEDDVVSYIHRQIERMPAFLRLPYRCIVIVFAVGAFFRYGRSFPYLPITRRRAWVSVWALSPIISMRDFVKMVRSCALLAWFDHPVVTSALLAEESHANPEPAS